MKRDNALMIIAGPCAVESEGMALETAQYLAKRGVRWLRGGVFKPRTSPHSFQGLKEKGIPILHEVKRQTGLKIVTEALSVETLPLVAEVADIVQIGSRNMQNFPLLQAVGKLLRPVLLKRGFGNTIEEWLMSAEYILQEGNPNVILCERGIRTFEPATRHTLDINAIAVVKEKSRLPIIVDPSHAAGDSRYVESLALAAIAAGADGLLIEVHPNPASALSDGQQSLTFLQFDTLFTKLQTLALAVNRKI